MFLAVKETFTIIVVEYACDDRDECCFAGAGGANEHEKLSIVDIKVYTPKGLYLIFAGTESFCNGPALYRNPFIKEICFHMVSC